MPTSHSLSETRDGDVTIVSVGPDFQLIDETNVGELSQRLLEIAQKANPRLVVLDLSSTEFFGSSFLEVLFRIWKSLRRDLQSRFAISGLQTYCREVLAITRLDSLWEVYDSSTAAAAALNDQTTRP